MSPPLQTAPLKYPKLFRRLSDRPINHRSDAYPRFSIVVVVFIITSTYKTHCVVNLTSLQNGQVLTGLFLQGAIFS